MNVWFVIIAETLAITVIGSLLHFTYEWCDCRKWVSFFAAVNESTWEHMKLAFSGAMCCTLVDVWFLGDNPNYWLAKGASFVTILIVMPILFYGYTSFTRRAVLPVDISIFAITAFMASWIFVMVLSLAPVGAMWETVGGVVSFVIIVAYLLLTFFPIRGNVIFEDPLNHKYGLDAAKKRKAVKKRTRR